MNWAFFFYDNADVHRVNDDVLLFQISLGLNALSPLAHRLLIFQQAATDYFDSRALLRTCSDQSQALGSIRVFLESPMTYVLAIKYASLATWVFALMTDDDVIVIYVLATGDAWVFFQIHAPLPAPDAHPPPSADLALPVP